ncbi:uncharacterized protein LOC135503075 [Lineus longissimus]|uniref:uncharacterized protein LOC135503075 n=1 Tax=Lineus longissimus TaxID=88925 RepID=UPI002B4E9963
MAQRTTEINHYLSLIISIAFSIGFLSTRWLGVWDAEFYVYIYIIALFSSSIIAMAFCWRKNSDSESLTIRGRDTVNERHRSVSVIATGGLVVFFVGSAVNDIYGVVALSACMDTYIHFGCGTRERLGDAIGMTIGVLYLATQVMFLIWAGYRQFERGMKFRLPFLLNTISNVTIIFYIMLDEAEGVKPSRIWHCRIWPPLNTTDMHCVNKTTSFFETVEAVGGYLTGFHSEFAVLATSLNLALFNAASHVTGSGISVTLRGKLPSALDADASWEHDRADDDGAELSTEEDISSRRYGTYILQDSQTLSIQQSAYGALEGSAGQSGQNQVKTSYGSIWTKVTRLCCVQCGNLESDSPDISPLLPWEVRSSNFQNRCKILAFLSMGLVLVYTVFMLLLTTDYGQKKIFAPISFLANALYLVMLVFTVSLRNQAGKALQNGPVSDRHIGVEGGVLFFSHFCLILFIFMTSIPSVYYLFAQKETRTDASLPETVLQLSNITSIVLLILQVTIQTKAIFYLNWIRKRNRVDGSTFDSAWPIICFLMVANFGQWFCETMVEIRTPEYRPTAVRYYGKVTWATIIRVLFPFIIYYRYHSTTLFAEFLLWGRSARQHPQAW